MASPGQPGKGKAPPPSPDYPALRGCLWTGMAPGGGSQATQGEPEPKRTSLQGLREPETSGGGAGPDATPRPMRWGQQWQRGRRQLGMVSGWELVTVAWTGRRSKAHNDTEARKVVAA